MENPLLGAWRGLVEESPGSVALVESLEGRVHSRSAIASGASRVSEIYREEVPHPLRRRVALAIPNGSTWLHVFIGLIEAGAVPVPIDPSEPEDARRSASAAA